MSSVASFFKLFRGAPASADSLAAPAVTNERIARRSSGLAEFNRWIAGREGITVLDLGPTSAANITHFTNLAHRSYNEDVLLASTDPTLVRNGDDGKPAFDVDRFLRENLRYDAQLFDAVLLWDMADYLPESLVKPVVERLHATMKPGAAMLAFFHTKDAGPQAPYYRYHIAANQQGLMLQPVWKSGNGNGNGKNGSGAARPMFRLQRVYANRHIENLFRDFASLKFFLARDNVREVLIVR